MPRRKIAFIHPDLGIGGAERLVLDVASALSQQGDDVYFLTNHFNLKHAFEELKTGRIRVDVYGDWLPRTVFGRFQAVCAYIRIIYLTLIYAIFYKKSDNPDLFFVDLIPVAVPILKLWGEKVIYYCHHPDLLASPPGGKLKDFYRKPIDWVELKSTGQADVLLVNSEYTESVFRDTFPEIQKPIQVIYPTIAASFLDTIDSIKHPRKIQEIFPDMSTPPTTVFLSINRFHPAKKLDLAILSMELLKSKCTEEEWNGVYLVVAGGFDPNSPINASYYANLEQLATEKDLLSHIIFLKSPPDRVKTELLLACDCLIYTPVKEHFGIVPLEAMAVSKPVIACNSGGPRETVEHSRTGYLCEPNAVSMSGFMKKILDKETAKQMGVQGKRNLEQKFTFSIFAKSVQKVVNINKIS